MTPLMFIALTVSFGILGFVFVRALTQHDWRRLPGVLSTLALVTVFTKIAWDIHINPSSHNLLPFELIIWSLMGLLIYGMLSAIFGKIKGSKNEVD